MGGNITLATLFFTFHFSLLTLNSPFRGLGGFSSHFTLTFPSSIYSPRAGGAAMRRPLRSKN